MGKNFLFEYEFKRVTIKNSIDQWKQEDAEELAEEIYKHKLGLVNYDVVLNHLLIEDEIDYFKKTSKGFLELHDDGIFISSANGERKRYSMRIYPPYLTKKEHSITLKKVVYFAVQTIGAFTLGWFANQLLSYFFIGG